MKSVRLIDGVGRREDPTVAKLYVSNWDASTSTSSEKLELGCECIGEHIKDENGLDAS